MLTDRPGLGSAGLYLEARERAKHMLGRRADLTLDETLRLAHAATGGLTDAGDTYYENGLQALLDSARLADLTLVGRRVVRDQIWPALARRLLLQRERTRRPEVFSAPLRRPFLVMGLARSGTTHLHRLLAVDDRFAGLPMWQLADPFPPDDAPDRRRADAWSRFDARKQGTTDHIHYVDPDTPEECSILQMNQFVSGLYWGAAPLYDYADWLIELGNAFDRPMYADYRNWLLWLQAQHPDRALALKAPDHAARLGAIAEFLPEAMIVNTVRDPLPTVNSSHSLVYQYHRRTARRIDVERTVDVNMRAIRWLWEAHRDQRSGPMCDVRYDDLISDPIGVVRSIYDFHGLDWPDGHDERLRDHLTANTATKHGSHAYRSEDFGLTDASIRERFADYSDYFGLTAS